MPTDAIYRPTKCLLFFALLWNEENLSLENLLTEIKIHWPADFSLHDVHYFPMVNYYQKEMGQPLARKILVLHDLLEREFLIKAKLWAMELEKKTAIKGNRAVNIDPGLIGLEQVLLISTKPFSHRIYLDHNLYADLTYTYKDNSYHVLPWTYPDYQNHQIVELFNQLRKKIKL